MLRFAIRCDRLARNRAPAKTLVGMAPDLLKPDWQSRFEPIGDVRLHWVEAGPKRGPAVILLHGFPEFWWAWRHQIDPLAAAGYRVIVPDMRGYNLSDAPAGLDAYRADRLSGDIANLADACGLSRFGLVGHDWGGLIAWQVAARHGTRLDRLVILDAPHPEVFAGFALRHPTQALRSTYIGWFQIPWLPEAALRMADFALLKSALRSSARKDVFSDAVLGHYADAWRQPGRLRAMLNYYRAMRLPGAAPLGRIAVPTLIVWGSRDQALDPRLAAESGAMVEQATIRVLEDATHWLHLEEPDRVTAELLAFLKA